MRAAATAPEATATAPSTAQARSVPPASPARGTRAPPRLLSTVILGYAASEVGGRFGRRLEPGARPRLLQAQVGPGRARLARWLEQPVDWDAEFEADPGILVGVVQAAASLTE
jgi:hypothetical protein